MTAALDILASVLAAAEPLVFSRLHALLDNQADATDDGRYKLLLADMHMYMLYVDLKAHTYQIRIEGGREGTEVDGPVLKLPATDAAAVALIKKIQAEFKAAEANVEVRGPERVLGTEVIRITHAETPVELFKQIVDAAFKIAKSEGL